MLSIEVWSGTYLQRGISAALAEFALDAFTSARMTRILDDPSEQVIVSENDDGLDGFIRLSHGRTAPVPGCSRLAISTLYVQPRHQGRGLGAALLAQGHGDARSLGAPSVWLTCNSENTPAKAFYLRQGFENLGTTQVLIQGRAWRNDVFARPVEAETDDRPRRD